MALIPVISRLSSRIIRILGCNPGPMTLQGTNTYLIGTGQRRILLDTGDPDVPQYMSNLNKVLKDENVILDHVIISHWHHDHIGGLKNLCQDVKQQCKVWKHPCLKDEHFSSYGVNLEKLEDGREFTVEGATLRVLHTPGHTTDHVVLVLNEEEAVFSADCILGEGTAVFEDLHDYMNSLRAILSCKPKVIYPGHGNVIEDPIERIEYYIEHRNKREREILQALKQNGDKCWTEMELVKEIYRDTPEQLFMAASYNVNHHLVKLLKENRVVKTEDSLWKCRWNDKL